MSFIWPRMLYLLLLLLPAAVAFYWYLQRRRQQATAAWGSLGMVQNRTGQPLGRRRHLPALFFLGSIALMLFSLARPEMVIDLPRVEGTVILALDVSSSMLATDLEPTRMEAAKAAAQLFVENQPSTINIGVVAFSNGGLVIQPPTNDQVAVIDTIQRLSPQGNTSLGQGIFTSLNAIAGEPLAIDEAGLEELDEGEMPTYDIGRFPSSVIILLSDGENRSLPDPLQVAQLAAEAGVRIYPVGIGSAAGAVVEIDGFSILTQLDEALLQQLADLTNGQYYHAADEATLEEIYQNIDLRLAISGEETEITSLVAGLSVLLLLIGGGLSMMWFGRIP